MLPSLWLCKRVDYLAQTLLNFWHRNEDQALSRKSWCQFEVLYYMLDFCAEMDHDRCSQLTLAICKLDQDLYSQIRINIKWTIHTVSVLFKIYNYQIVYLLSYNLIFLVFFCSPFLLSLYVCERHTKFIKFIKINLKANIKTLHNITANY